MNGTLLGLVGYLIGSIPFSYLVARLFGVADVRTVGSGNVGATNVMRSAGKVPGVASVVSIAELFAGVREGRERASLEAFIAAFNLIPVDREIAERGGIYRRDFMRSHRLGLADALVAATADVMDADLATLNVNHFPMRPRLKPPYAK